MTDAAAPRRAGELTLESLIEAMYGAALDYGALCADDAQATANRATHEKTIASVRVLQDARNALYARLTERDAATPRAPAPTTEGT